MKLPKELQKKREQAPKRKTNRKYLKLKKNISGSFHRTYT